MSLARGVMASRLKAFQSAEELLRQLQGLVVMYTGRSLLLERCLLIVSHFIGACEIPASQRLCQFFDPDLG